ncbi:MAG: DNA repair protein RecO [Verrucomicrobia bacterium]|nr:DNA repair protein RecO [Verrucomicrobiota bacterium]
MMQTGLTQAVEGITLSSLAFQENSHIISVFSKEHGRIKCITKSSRKSTVRGLGPLLGLEMQVMVSDKELWKCQECQVTRSYPQLRSSLTHLRFAAQITDLLDKLLPLHHPVGNLYVLYCQFLDTLGTQSHPHIAASIFLEKLLIAEGMLEKECDAGSIDLGYYHKLLHMIQR